MFVCSQAREVGEEAVYEVHADGYYQVSDVSAAEFHPGGRDRYVCAIAGEEVRACGAFEVFSAEGVEQEPKGEAH